MEVLQDIEPDIRALEIEELAALLLRNNQIRNTRLGIRDDRFRVSRLGARNVERAVQLDLLVMDSEEL